MNNYTHQSRSQSRHAEAKVPAVIDAASQARDIDEELSRYCMTDSEAEEADKYAAAVYERGRELGIPPYEPEFPDDEVPSGKTYLLYQQAVEAMLKSCRPQGSHESITAAQARLQAACDFCVLYDLNDADACLALRSYQESYPFPNDEPRFWEPFAHERTVARLLSTPWTIPAMETIF